jgi:branched-chain amino acid transport system substrate-binding protein
MLGTTTHVDGFDFAVLDNMMIFPAEEITTPVGQISEEWVQTLSPDMVDLEVKTYQHGS